MVRDPVIKLNKLHPSSKQVYNKMIQKPEPLAFKLQQNVGYEHLKEPLGNTTDLPFQIERTNTNNLPVYTEFKNYKRDSYTVVRKVSGDVETLVQELSKVTSNSAIYTQTGSLKIKGLHTKEIKRYLYGLGF